MTNHTFTLPADATHDDETYAIAMLPTTNDDARALMMTTARILTTRMLHDIDRLANDDFSDDDTDYMPARANTVAALIFATASVDETPLESLTRLLASHDFIDDLLTCDTDLPLDIDFTD